MLIKYARDTRYGLEGVVTHDKLKSRAKSCSSLQEARAEASDFEVGRSCTRLPPITFVFTRRDGLCFPPLHTPNSVRCR
jgi:hypothetical protein